MSGRTPLLAMTSEMSHSTMPLGAILVEQVLHQSRDVYLGLDLVRLRPQTIEYVTSV